MNTFAPTSTEARRGSIACVGMGMTLGSHLTPLSRSHIETADVVFAALSDHVVELWLRRLNPEVRSLQPYYRPGKSRMKTYREWVEVMITEDAPSPFNPLGIKGVGEAGCSAAGAAIASAIDDAIGMPGAVTELP